MEKEFLATVTDVVPQIIWTNDVEGKANYFNQRWYEYTGLSYNESAGPGWQALAHEDDFPAVEAWRNAFHEKRMFEHEARLLDGKGQYQWHLLRNVPFTDVHGRVQGWFGSATNIQSIKDAQAVYRQTAGYLKAILDTAIGFAIITLDQKGNIIGWTSGAEQMFGYSESEVLGKPTGILFTEEDRVGGIPERELEIAGQSGRALDERWHLRKDGARFFMSGVMTPMKDHYGFVKVTRNITDRKLAEEALLIAEHRNNMALQSGQMGEWNWDLRSHVILLDEKAQNILHKHEKNAFDVDDFWSIIHADDLTKVKDEFKKAVGGGDIFQSELRVQTNAEDEYRWVNWYGRVINHANDVPSKMIGVVYDITDRKALEKQKDEFISLASHELKTPITSIKAYSELVHDVLLKSGQEKNAQLVDKLNTQVDRLINLFNVLLDSTRVTQGRLNLNIETIDLNTLIEERLAELRYLSAGHKLIFEPSPMGLVHADKDRIGQVITNLVSNAMKYSPLSSTVIISSEDGLDGAIVKVQDFGIGITEEEKANLFKQYYRGSQRQANKQPGFGLGLYISAEIIRQHHGLISVESTPGEGSTFFFKLLYT